MCFSAIFVIFQDPLAGRSIFSGNLFQYLEENRKWRNRFISVPNSYTISFYDGKTVRQPSNVINQLTKFKRGCENRLDSLWSLSQAHERGLHPKGTINCAGYKALTSIEEYMELINASLPGGKWTCRAIWAQIILNFCRCFTSVSIFLLLNSLVLLTKTKNSIKNLKNSFKHTLMNFCIYATAVTQNVHACFLCIHAYVLQIS